ncbi:MAG: exonuclease SbcCD subunit D [Anaerolineales bacterium]|nr:exonuclease SbcCD subunit D [Chloroflexota bacterium]MBL6983571.1 exonuclease SbcCD subunit D [Anaerolineales bacterium]
MIKILHFADAHIDMATHGRHDPESGLPMRVMDFLKSLDTIVDSAINEKVDLVLFAGDAYKDRNPAPTYQREWGKRIMRLSQAGIQTLLLVGNHDLSPAMNRAHAMTEFSTLQVPHVQVLDRPCFLTPDDLDGLPLQVLAIPWISRSGMMAHLDIQGRDLSQIYEELEERLTDLVHHWLDDADSEIPIVLTAHASVQGAKYGGERTVMLGGDLVLPGSLVKDQRLDYVALGHIHKPQDLNKNTQPPVIYPGSIERVDFGEADDDKFYVIAEVDKGATEVAWRQITGIRTFVDRFVRLESQEGIIDQLRSALPPKEKLKDAIVRLVLEYPREWESMIDEASLREHAAEAFEFHLVKRPQQENRIRLPEDQTVGTLSPQELLEIYWKANHADPETIEELKNLAGEIIQGE